MDHQQLRTVLTEHFSQFLASQKAEIDASGPLSSSNRELLENTIAIAELELNDGPIDMADTDRTALEFVQKYELDLKQGTPLFETFKRSLAQAHRDYSKAVLSYSDKAETFEFSPISARPNDAADAKLKRMSLQQLVEQFWKYAQQEGRWSDKTEGEKREHIELLYERLGRDIDVNTIGREQAHLMRDTLVAYPVNRNKGRKTRGKPLLEVLDMPDVAKLHNITINKYLQTYNGLFNWALQNGLCSANPFMGLRLRAKDKDDEAPRLPFSVEQLQSVQSAVLTGHAGQMEHHKWGVLIAIHTGARLNEIAQLHLEDIRQVDGIWCFDINRKPGTLKKLKNASSKRIVPIHPQLIEYGLLKYVESMKDLSGNQRLFPGLTYSKSDGFGRNLGRWVNETLLPDLGIKTRQLTFHSFRHTMVGKLIAADISQAHIMAIVGHEPGTTTLKTYNRNGFPPKLLLNALQSAL